MRLDNLFVKSYFYFIRNKKNFIIKTLATIVKYVTIMLQKN